MLRAWQKYGEDVFGFKTIEEVEDESLLLEREQYWMDLYECYSPEKGYNICKFAGNTLGYEHTEEVKLALSEIAKKRAASPEFHLSKHKFKKGHVMSPEVRRKISEASSRNQQGEKSHNAKLSNKDVVEIIKLVLSGESDTSIGAKYGVKRATINNIRHRKSFKCVTDTIIPGDLPIKKHKSEEDK